MEINQHAKKKAKKTPENKGKKEKAGHKEKTTPRSGSWAQTSGGK
jgi:hypothetical protein